MKKSLILSLLIHLVLGLLLWRVIPVPPPKPTDYQVEFIPELHEIRKSSKSAPSKSRPQKPSISRDVLRDFFKVEKQTSQINGLKLDPNHSPGLVEGRLSEKDTADASVNIVEDLQGTPFFFALWTEINSSIEYPDDFVKQRISGSVAIQFEVDHRGVLTALEKVSSGETFLKTYVLAALIQSLKNPLAERVWHKEEKLRVSARFDFLTYSQPNEKSEEKSQREKSIYHDNFLFVRAANVGPIINDYIERIFTRYVPPIIPLPGGFYVDFYRAYKMIEHYSSPTMDRNGEHRLSMLKERLQLLINQSNLKMEKVL